ncbi:MAG: hypothetical protein Q7S62_02015 [bacterium]|nr:hypothetical protein [bacterium]
MKQDISFWMNIVVAAVVVSGIWLYATGALVLDANKGEAENAVVKTGDLESQVLPADGIVLPIQWGDLGMQMMETGVIDEEKLTALYESRGGLPEDMRKLLYESDTQEVRMTYENSGVLLNLLWGFGLGNKNSILETGPMMDPRFNGAGNFASTGGWTLARGNAMDHYSKYAFVALTPEQQALVERVSQGIFRPCCGNSTYFPDCNHGMAMLGLLELLAYNGVSEEEMYRVALQVNSYWFPDTYLTIASYFAKQGVSWDKVSPKEALGNEYSSGSGYQRVRALVEPVQQQGGGGCGL